MKKLIYSVLLVACGLITITSCELDLQESPNVLTPEKSDPDFLLNGIQLNFSDLYQTAQDIGGEVTRQENLFGTSWESAFSATSFDGIWTDAYANIIIESKTLQEIAVENELYYHAGIAQTLQAYTMVTLVDYFGEVPYSEAFDPTNFAPNADPGASVYDAALTLLADAKANFNLTPLAGPDNDLYYGGDADMWIKAVNTLMLRINLQKRLVDASGATSAINALLSEDNLIEANDEAMVFLYGTQQTPVLSQHPDYSGNYTNGANEYMATYFMDKLLNEKTNPDPRMRYYFYRQVTVPPTDVTLKECIGAAAPPWYAPSDAFCLLADGYWGRDHLDNAGIPPDNELRTTYGIYPAGGKYDNDDAVLAQQGDGLGGAGIDPVIMPFTTSFMKAEAALMLGTAGDARALLEEGVRRSMDYVTNFWFSGGAATQGDIDNYVSDVLANYDNATSDSERLEVIVNEAYIAGWGNGIDAYNTYRRTGFPSDMQPALRLANPGLFYRSFTYPASYVNRNSNANQKDNNAVQVFWDNNPAGFVD